RPDDPRIGRIEACIPNTAPGEPFCTFPSPAPDRKIDYIFATPHFRAYKEGTPHMIKSLKLVPMSPLDAEGMKLIFRKNTVERN
ncbi:MAG: hypothetical protein IKS45_01370, partial [Thermoguttaceae bacterium]|nr:hypothetical protein [Thermoguttaceae bacterium]